MSNSTQNDTAEECPVAPHGGAFITYLFIFLYIIVIITSIFGNISILVVVWTRRAMRTFTNILICNCACADLFITLFSAVFAVVDTLMTKGKWYFGSFMCSFVHFIVIASVAANILTLLVIAIDRLYAVKSPYKKMLTNRMLSVIVPTIWLVGFGFASPVTFTQSVVYNSVNGSVNGTSVNEPRCLEVWTPPFKKYDSPKHYTMVLFVCLYALPLFFMSILYVQIAKTLGCPIKLRLSIRYFFTNSENNNDDSSLTPVDSNENNNGRNAEIRCSLKGNEVTGYSIKGFQKGRVIRMLIVMVVVFAICWLPVFILQFLVFFNPYYMKCYSSIPDWLYALSYFMQYANSAIDPLLYFWFSSTFRKELRVWSRDLVELRSMVRLRMKSM